MCIHTVYSLHKPLGCRSSVRPYGDRMVSALATGWPFKHDHRYGDETAVVQARMLSVGARWERPGVATAAADAIGLCDSVALRSISVTEARWRRVYCTVGYVSGHGTVVVDQGHLVNTESHRNSTDLHLTGCCCICARRRACPIEKYSVLFPEKILLFSYITSII